MNQILIDSFKQTLKSTPFVFTKITVNFGIYFIGLFFMALLVLDDFSLIPLFKESTKETVEYTTLAFNGLCYIFIIFIIPYYAYKYDNKGTAITPFWTFLGKTLWPVIINSIKAILIIFLFLLLLIIPGFYKSIRLYFLTQTIFFDDIHKPLKTTQNTTQGYFWLIALFLLLTYLLTIFLSPILDKKVFEILNLAPSFSSKSVILGLWFFFNFFIYAFIELFKNQFYFAIKKHRMEPVSL